MTIVFTYFYTETLQSYSVTDNIQCTQSLLYGVISLSSSMYVFNLIRAMTP